MKTVTLFLTQSISLEAWKRSGLLQRELRLYSKLSSRNCHFNIITYGDSSDLLYQDEVPGVTLLPLYSRIHSLPNRYLAFLQGFLIPFLFSTHLKNSDVLKTNQLWGAHIAVISKIMFKKPLLIRTGYDLYTFCKFQFRNPFFLFLISLYTRFCYFFADRVHVSSDSDSSILSSKFSVSPSKIHVFPNWIDTSLFKPLRDSHSDTALASRNILFVGRLTKQKNLFTIIESISNTHYSLHIVGDGPLRSELEDFSQQVNSNVVFLGAIANSLLPNILHRYQIFVFPSYYEGNPKALLEAMACGLVVIANNSPGINSLITHNSNGLLFENSPSSFLDVLLTVESSPKLVEFISLNAREYILMNNSLDILAENEYQSYSSLLYAHS
jgi:glycosyltransferase involved in cell wall biosynthesis